MNFNPDKTSDRKISKTKLDKTGKFLSNFTHETSKEEDIDKHINTLNH